MKVRIKLARDEASNANKHVSILLKLVTTSDNNDDAVVLDDDVDNSVKSNSITSICCTSK